TYTDRCPISSEVSSGVTCRNRQHSGGLTMLTRREFIGAGIGVAAAAEALALLGEKMATPMGGNQFPGLKPHPETGIKMTAQYGYHGLEPFQDDMPQYLKQPPEVFKNLLDDPGIPLCTI